VTDTPVLGASVGIDDPGAELANLTIILGMPSLALSVMLDNARGHMHMQNRPTENPDMDVFNGLIGY
jgi:hypothetical protein